MSIFDDIERLVANPAEKAPPRTRTKPVVLLVDDDDGVRRALDFALSRDYELRLCDHGSKVAPALDERVACVVLDIKMPKISGFDVCELVQRHDPLIPIVFHSAYQDLKSLDVVEATYKPFAYVTKDGDIERLRRTIERAVAHRNVQRARREAASQIDEAQRVLRRLPNE